MLAHTFKPKKHGIGGWFMSKKLDGQRAFWDGGISRGILKEEIPWANCDRDERLLNEQVSTGLWSRLGNVIHAPKWWLDKLPVGVMTDGELDLGKLGHGERQNLRKIIAKHTPGPGWKKVTFMVFDLPPLHAVFADGRVVYGPRSERIFKDVDLWDCDLVFDPKSSPPFVSVVRSMQHLEIANDVVIIHEQVRLPFQTEKALAIIDEALNRYVDAGGEGLMLRKPESTWTPKRMHELLKVKKLDDAEGIVTGYTSGRETTKGSKLLGLMGALILNYNGKRLELSGFTEAERALGFAHGHEYEHTTPEEWAENHPGQEVPDWISAVYFPRGSTVTFQYRGESLDGIPTEARYWRKRDV